MFLIGDTDYVGQHAMRVTGRPKDTSRERLKEYQCDKGGGGAKLIAEGFSIGEQAPQQINWQRLKR